MTGSKVHRGFAIAFLMLSVTVLLAVTPSPVHASGATVVQQSSGFCDQPEGYDCSSGMVTASFSNAVASGDVIVVGVFAESSTGVSSVTDSLGSSFTKAVSLVDKTGIETVYIYNAPLSLGGTDSVTVSYSLSGTALCNSPTTTTCALDVYIYEVSGVTTVGAATGSGTANGQTLSTSSVAFDSGAFLLGMSSQVGGYTPTPGTGFTLSTQTLCGCSAAEYATSGVSSPTSFPITTSYPSNPYYLLEVGLALQPGTFVVATADTTVASYIDTTASASTTSTSQTTSTTSATTVSEPLSITNTLITTTTTTGSIASTSTTTFTSPFSTSYSTSSTVSSSESITQTGVTTVSTVSSATTTSTGTLLSSTTSSETLTITQTDTFNVLLTTIYQELYQFSDGILQFLGFQVTATPVGQQVNQVIVTATPQVTMTVSYSVVGGGSPTAPVFHYVLNSVKKSLTLTTTPKAVLVDAGSAWSVTPNPLKGSDSSQRWHTTQPLIGTASATTLDFTFQHEYYLTMKVSGSGTVSPSSGWHDAGQTVTIRAIPNAGHKFNSWKGTGTGSFTGTTTPATITMNSAITETARFT